MQRTLFLALYLASIIACLSEQSEMHEKQQTERHNLKQCDSEQEWNATILALVHL